MTSQYVLPPEQAPRQQDLPPVHPAAPPPQATPPAIPALTFPPHTAPRTWLITSAPSPVGISVARAALEHGDNVVLGVPPTSPFLVNLIGAGGGSGGKGRRRTTQRRGRRRKSRGNARLDSSSGGSGSSRWGSTGESGRDRTGVDEDGDEDMIIEEEDEEEEESGREGIEGDERDHQQQQQKPKEEGVAEDHEENGNSEEVMAARIRAELQMPEAKGIEGEEERMRDFFEFWREVCTQRGSSAEETGGSGASWRERSKIVGLDGRCESLFVLV